MDRVQCSARRNPGDLALGMVQRRALFIWLGRQRIRAIPYGVFIKQASMASLTISIKSPEPICSVQFRSWKELRAAVRLRMESEW